MMIITSGYDAMQDVTAKQSVSKPLSYLGYNELQVRIGSNVKLE